MIAIPDATSQAGILARLAAVESTLADLVSLEAVAERAQHERQAALAKLSRQVGLLRSRLVAHQEPRP